MGKVEVRSVNVEKTHTHPREVLARDAMRSGVHTRAQTLSGYLVSN